MRARRAGFPARPCSKSPLACWRKFSQLSDGKLPLVGVGGIDSAEAAYAKIRAGASAVQLYSALVYEGFSLVERVVKGLDALLARDGFATIAEAVGTGRDAWL